MSSLEEKPTEVSLILMLDQFSKMIKKLEELLTLEISMKEHAQKLSQENPENKFGLFVSINQRKKIILLILFVLLKSTNNIKMD